ncbi:type IV pilin protein [Pseudoalteromonas xiamenensis]|uniref:Type IV pilin protein n=1 Tax=Pseudoalteromonas xiamenensis TaxID=882626 RepID=A0A975DF07_9GAMM|nr:type IV pilin protein [Pseudoalteromonas xiamenensis]
MTAVSFVELEVKSRFAGFTLVELLIAIAILGILYSLAMPSYARYIQESRRNEAQQTMFQTATHLERIYTRQGGYPKNYDVPVSEYYTFTYVPLTAIDDDYFRAYKLSAAPKSGSGQTGDICGTLSIDHQSKLGASSDGCW